MSVSGGGVLESSQNAAAAQAFLEFITGVDGQTILQTGDSFEYAIASDVAANPRSFRSSSSGAGHRPVHARQHR